MLFCGLIFVWEFLLPSFSWVLLINSWEQSSSYWRANSNNVLVLCCCYSVSNTLSYRLADLEISFLILTFPIFLRNSQITKLQKPLNADCPWSCNHLIKQKNQFLRRSSSCLWENLSLCSIWYDCEITVFSELKKRVCHQRKNT